MTMKITLTKMIINMLASWPIAPFGKRLFGQGIPIFMLHRMQNGESTKEATGANYLRYCLEYLADQGYRFLSLYDLLIKLKEQQEIPGKCVVFTMDDGFDDQVTIAAPIFLEFNCPVTIFLITGMLDNILWPWDDKVAFMIDKSNNSYLDVAVNSKQYHLSLDSREKKSIAISTIRNAIKAADNTNIEKVLLHLEAATKVDIPEKPPKEYKPLTWELAREYEHKGIQFAPHSISHRILSRLDDASMRNEILGSWKRLNEELSSPKPVFCYPTGRYGDYSKREMKLLNSAGFIGAVSTIPAQIRPEIVNNDYLYSLPRYSLPHSFHTFVKYCTWFEYAREKNLDYWSNNHL